MKKKKDYLLLIVLIPLFVYLLLTWFIPTGNLSGGEFVKGEVSSLGLYGLFSAPVTAFTVLAQNVIFLLCVGGFYGVLNKTGVYQNIVDFLANENKKVLLIVSVIIFALISSLFGGTMFVFSSSSSLFGGSMMAFLLLPFFITVLVKAGYSKVSSIAATVGSTLVGILASTTGNLGFLKNYLSMEPKMYIIYNIIMIVVLTFLLCMFIIIKDKKENPKKESVKDIPLYEVSKDNKKSSAPLIIILVVTFLLIVVGGYNWDISHGFKGFVNLHEWIVGKELLGTNIFTRLFGNFSEIGAFSINDVSAIIIIMSLVIAWVYSIKDSFASFINGAKEMLLPSIYIVLASVIFTQVLTTNGSIYATVINPIIKISKDFNVFTGTLTGIVGSFFFNDSLYLVNGLYGIITTFDATKLPLIVNVLQSTFGVMMFVLPVSILLVGSLKYINVSYKEWIKYIWIFVLQAFAISVIGNVILSMII